MRFSASNFREIGGFGGTAGIGRIGGIGRTGGTNGTGEGSAKSAESTESAVWRNRQFGGIGGVRQNPQKERNLQDRFAGFSLNRQTLPESGGTGEGSGVIGGSAKMRHRRCGGIGGFGAVGVSGGSWRFLAVRRFRRDSAVPAELPGSRSSLGPKPKVSVSVHTRGIGRYLSSGRLAGLATI